MHSLIRVSAFVFFIFITCISADAQVLINEVQSSNGETISDEDGDYEDWIELYNTGDEPVNLAGYTLSDDDDDPLKWILPSVEIEPGEFLHIWTSGKDRTDAEVALHTNFSIRQEGEELTLTDASGTQIDEFSPVSIPRDVSFGRDPDGSDNWFFFSEPTPGQANTSQPYQETLDTPEFSHAGGTYTSPFTLTLSASNDADIYYTMDGSLPEPEAAQEYTGPIDVNTTLVIRARAFKEDAIPSETSSKLYTPLDSGVSAFDSNLPVFILHQFDTEITPGERTPAWLTVMNGEDNGRVNLAGESNVQSFIRVNKRGSSSLSFPKNMFGFHLVDEDDSNRDESLLDLPADHNWILYAPYTDMTLMRNVVAYRLAEEMGWYAPRTKFVELFLQDGNGPLTEQHYHGVYVLTERIKWHEDRVDITQLSPGDDNEPEISGGYIIKKDRLNEGESGFYTRRGSHFAYARPNEEDVTQAQEQWITDYMSDFEDALFGSNFTDPSVGYEAYIETDSFIDHFLITELLKEIDGYRLSTFMYKDRGEKLVMGPVWDFNLSIGIADYLDGWKPEGWYYPLPAQNNECFAACEIMEWYERLMEDDSYQEQLESRWWELRDDLFSKENLSSLIRGNQERLEEAQQRNFTRWPTLGEYVWPNWYVGNTWEDEIDWMEDWLMNRVDWIDSQMGNPPDEPNDSTLNYWYFNTDIPNDTPLETLTSTYRQVESGKIEYRSSMDGYPFDEEHDNWRKASMERRNQPTPLNYREDSNQGEPYEEDEMRGLQVRQPFRGAAGENSLIFHIPVPSEEYENYQFAFAAMDEGAADELIIDYNIASGTPQWETSALSQSRFDLYNSYNLYEIEFSDPDAITDNSDFKIRIRFDGEEMEADDGERITFNNISFEGINASSSNPAPGGEIPEDVTLNQNYPNPFNSSTQIRFGLPETTHTEISVYNILGQRVAKIVDEQRSAGFHEVNFDASNLSSGLYFYRLNASNQTISKKLMLVK